MSVIINPLVAGGATGGGSTVVNNTTINNIQNITNNNYTATGNGVLAGGGVVLTGSYGYLVGAATYSIQGTQYTSPQTTGTLATADPTNPRIDIFVLGIDGTASVITGTAAATPSAPFVDPALYVETGFVLVPANAPPALTNEQIYQEDTGGPGEWNFTTSGTGITLNSTANPYTGTTNIQLASVASGSYWQGQRPATTIDSGQFNSFAFAFFPTAFANNKSLTIQLYNSSVPVGNPISFRNGSQAFNSSLASYQVIVYPTSVFGAAGVTFNQIRFTVAGAGAAMSGSFDYCFFQSAVVPVLAPAPMVYRDVWNTTSGYNTNDVVIVGTLNNVTAYVALQPNVNQVPGTATTIWRQITQSTLIPLTLGAGSTAITHATHSNRLLIVNQAGATGAVFAVTATSGAVDGDEVYILNIGAGTMTASGTVSAATGYTLTIGPGVMGSFVYSATANAYYSTTPSSAGGAGTVTSVSIVTANGVSGSVANPTTTPAITLNVDAAIAAYLASFDSKPEVAYASAAALPANTYANGILGVGATLTATANGPLIIDGVTLVAGAVGLRILVTAEAASANNGWYTLTQLGVVAVSPYILTRDPISDQAAEIGPGYLTAVRAPSALTGGTQDGTVFMSICAQPFTVGTTALTFSKVGGTGTVTSVDASGGVQTASGSPITAAGTIRGAHVVNAQSGTSYTLVTGDRGKHVTTSNAASIAVTLPQAGSGFEDGWFSILENIGVGATTITPTTSTINGNAALVLNTGQAAYLLSDGTNYRALVTGTGGILVNAQTGTSYTYLAGDRNKLVTHTNGSAIAGTLPQATTVFGSGWFMWVENRGVGTLTITPTTSTIDGVATLALITNQGCLIVSDGANYFTMRGVGGAASGGSASFAVFLSNDFMPPAANFETINQRNSRFLSEFDASTEETGLLSSIVPQGQAFATGIKVIIYWAAATATSGDVVWGSAFERGTTDIDADSFDTESTATTTTSGTSGIPNKTTISNTTIDSIVAGDLYWVKIARKAAAGGDTMTGFAQILAVELQSY